MRVLLLGYGRMGKAIREVLEARGHTITQILDAPSDLWKPMDAEVAIEFTQPESASDNIKRALDLGLPVVSGTTGWLSHYEEIVEKCIKQKGAFLYASNFSLGVNLFFELNRRLAVFMKSYPDYTASIDEIHHVFKLDAPSGTAISLAEPIISERGLNGWSSEGVVEGSLPIYSERIGEVAGIHEVVYRSDEDQLSIRHEAFDRSGFALGAVIAAEWLIGKEGVFGMKDVLGLE